MVTLKIGTKDKHEISPYLYMQFMEPLGVADASVDAAWDFVEGRWYPQVIDAVRKLAPTMVRFGGCTDVVDFCGENFKMDCIYPHGIIRIWSWKPFSVSSDLSSIYFREE